jgi:MSHA biogenesis protein MshJ
VSPKALLGKFTDWFDLRPQAEKFILAGIGVGGLLYLFLIVVYDPSRAEISSLERQLSTVQTRLLEQQTRAAELQRSGIDDPDSFIRERLAALVDEQSQIQGGIESLAGNLVSPNRMTQMLTSVLDNQGGLTLIKVENISPEALTDPMAPAINLNERVGGVLQSVGFQVFRHGLVLEFQGDYFNMLRYLLYLEGMDESFFWDSIEFKQVLWPDARVRLELHTLSSEEGFIGV